MNNRRISISITKTINTGNYESLKVSCGLDADIKDDINIDSGYDELYDVVKENLDELLDKSLQDFTEKGD